MSLSQRIVVALLLVSQVFGTCPSNVVEVPYSVVPDGYCAFFWAQPGTLAQPRQMITLSNNDVLAVEQGSGVITVLWLENNVLQNNTITDPVYGLNHAVQLNGDYLYASNQTTVFRWPFKVGTRTDLGEATIVVANLPCCHHTTRGLAFDSNNTLFVQVGSGSNVDPNPLHAEIRQYVGVDNLPSGGWDWFDGFLWAQGMRNEAGIKFDPKGRLWGVENGRDDLVRADFGDVHQENPCEEMNLFETPGLFYGYPYCWSVGNLTVNGTVIEPRTQYADPGFIDDGVHTDAWCQNASNVVKPVHCFRAHNAPLDILFLNTTFPADYQGIFVTFHGSWDATYARGYRVVHVSTDENGMPNGETPFFAYAGPGETGNNWPYRPVAMTVAPSILGEAVLVSDDAASSIIAIVYTGDK